MQKAGKRPITVSPHYGTRFLPDTLLNGVTLIPFVNAMHEIDTVSVAAFKEHELDAYFGMVYGMLKAGIRDHQIPDSAISACCAVRTDPGKY